MTKDEAWKIIEECKGWNADQQSISLALGGARTILDDALDAKREALKKAWEVLQE